MSDTQIKLIDKNTDISKLKMSKMHWDVEVNGIPYQVVMIEGYVHTIGGQRGENDLWMYPRDEEPTYENLVEYNCSDMGVNWGIRYQPYNYIRNKWDEPECFTTGGAMITRNGEDFYFCRGGIDAAKVLISRLQEHPAECNSINFDKDLVGRKVWWRSEPAVIRSYIKGQACVMLEPDGIDKFTVPAEFADEYGEDYYCDGDVKVEIFNSHIWWFRD